MNNILDSLATYMYLNRRVPLFLNLVCIDCRLLHVEKITTHKYKLSVLHQKKPYVGFQKDNNTSVRNLFLDMTMFFLCMVTLKFEISIFQLENQINEAYLNSQSVSAITNNCLLITSRVSNKD